MAKVAEPRFPAQLIRGGRRKVMLRSLAAPVSVFSEQFWFCPARRLLIAPAMFQFTIRDLLWLTVVTAFGVLWAGEIRQRRIDGAGLWEENLRLSTEREYAITLLGGQYQQHSSCDALSAREQAERHVTAWRRQERERRTY